ncbi:MAG: glycoside hydrolase family 127 protein, partial [Phocaeicola sp.]|nr:glycoside hydrolase family 127 protein [Phocaeicola sp.]
MKVKTLLWTAWIGLCCSCTQTGNQNVSSGFKDIVSVEAISVEAPVGTAPRLPFQVWVTYSDGSQEFRQAKWSNSSPVTEEAEANPQINPTGTTYSVKGYILGDNTTPNGYPISASIKVVDQPYATPSNTPVAETLPLDKVSVTGDNRLTWNRDLDIDEILKWDVSQQLYNYRDTYGLSTEGYKESDGWDSPTTKLKGHGTGHYMSALAFAFACCQDPAKREQLKQNITRMVNELRECQERTFVWDEKLGRYWEARDLAPEAELRQLNGTWADFDNYKKEYQKYGYGYLNAIPAQHPALIEMYRAYNNDNWVWAPYYSIHKQLAGLIDIATYIDDQAIADKALLIAKDMGLWVWNRLHYRTYVKSDGTQEERRAKPGNRYEMWNMYIAGEVGGMSESLARLSAMVKDATEKERLLEASNFFDSPAFFQPLSINVDAIRTRHANQHIPMIIGALRSFRLNNNPYYYHIAQNFWSFIQGRYRYAMGGVGNGEMFRQPYTQILNMATNASSWGGQG